ncbi:MAG: hypothetical protein OEW19_18060 [Acidobacteriota bacterium]|nr:hypothetical protein [Acidobacteriota bacterium]
MAEGLEADALIRGFMDRTLPKSQWTHLAHLRVGLWHVRRFGESEALARLREGIRRYNDAVGTPNTDASGYHETLTVFYVRIIGGCVAAGPSRRGETAAEADARILVEIGDRGLPLEYYSRQRLFSPEARRAWVPPDLRPLPSFGLTRRAPPPRRARPSRP